MPQPTFPSLSPTVKCAFRWVRNQELLTRYTVQCGGGSGVAECPYFINTPSSRLPPFQIYATDATQFGLAQPTAWKVYDMDDVEVQDLAADLDLLQVVQFSSPSREYIIYDGSALTLPLPSGNHYSVITSEAGEYFSEPFETICQDFEPITITPTLVDWGGLVSSFINSGPPPSPGTFVGQRVADFSDFIWTWDGDSWNSSAPVDGEIYGTGIGNTWYLYNLHGFGTIPIGEEPLRMVNGTLCWNGTEGIEVAWEFEEGGDIQITMDFQHNGGSFFDLQLDGDSLTIFGSGSATYSETLEIEDGSILTLDPNGTSPQGCITFYVFKVVSDASDCYKRLRWTNPCNLGTQYYEEGFENILYLDNTADLIQPTVEINEDEEEQEDGDETKTFLRKRITYRLSIDPIPWWLADSLTDAVLHKTVMLDDDTVKNLSVTPTWATEQTCLATTDITFSLLEDVVQANCCSPWDPPCLEPCETVIGEQSAPAGDGWYVVDGAKQVVERTGGSFGTPVACASGLVAGSGDYPDSYWDGDAWLPVAEVEVMFNNCTNVNVQGSVINRYYADIEVSTNGTDFVSSGTFTATEISNGVNTDVIPDITHIRVRVFVPTNCTIGYSVTQEVECMVVTVTEAGITGVNGTYVRLTPTSWIKGDYHIDWIDEGGGTSYWIMYLVDGGNITYYINSTSGVFVSLEDVVSPWSLIGSGIMPLPVVTA